MHELNLWKLCKSSYDAYIEKLVFVLFFFIACYYKIGKEQQTTRINKAHNSSHANVGSSPLLLSPTLLKYFMFRTKAWKVVEQRAT